MPFYQFQCVSHTKLLLTVPSVLFAHSLKAQANSKSERSNYTNTGANIGRADDLPFYLIVCVCVCIIKHLTPHLPLQLRASISISNRSYPSKTNQNEPNLKQIKSDKYLFAIIIVEFMNYICSHFVSISFVYISTDLHFLPENCLRFIIKL